MALDTEPEIQVSLAATSVPEHLHHGLMMYLAHRVRTGGFLEAVLSNNLKESFARADMESTAGMHALVRWLWRHAPSDAWGSPERVEAWLSVPRDT